MRSDDRLEFVRILNGMAAMKPGGKLTAEAIDMWWLAMTKWPIEDFKSAATHLVGAVEFMPSPFHFEQLRKADDATPGEAWAEALGGCVDWRNPEMLPDGRVARAAAAVGGFRVIAMADIEKDLPHLERRFKQAYEELTDVDTVREALPQIAGPRGDTRRLENRSQKLLESFDEDEDHAE